MDAIFVRGLVAETRVGVPEEERAAPQTVILDVELYLDLRAAGHSDDLNETLDYGAVTAGLVDLLGTIETKLLEHLAERMASYLLGLGKLRRVVVQVTKASPPIVETTEAVGVRIERTAE